MPTTITSHDGGVVTVPQVVAEPKSVAELQAILKDPVRFFKELLV